VALFGSPCGPDVTLSATKIVFGNPSSRQAVFRDPAGDPSGPIKMSQGDRQNFTPAGAGMVGGRLN